MDLKGRIARRVVFATSFLLIGAALGYSRTAENAGSPDDTSTAADAPTAADRAPAADVYAPVDTFSALEVPAEKELREDAPIQSTRFFKEVRDGGFSTAYNALSRLSSNGDFVLLVETDAARNPISDTLLVWVQHHGPDQPLAQEAAWADMIIACYPELLATADRTHHVLPEAKGKVWLYFLKGRYLIISDQRYPALDFALKAL